MSSEQPAASGERDHCRKCGAVPPPGRNAYCSRSCQDAWRRSVKMQREPAACAHCSKSFMALTARRRVGKGLYCSRPCVSAAHVAAGTFKGEKNPRWLGGVSNDNMRYRRRQRERWPEREAARRAVAEAIRLGALVRGPCEVCAAAKTEGHHDDYSRPLGVRWLCRTHHDAHHAEHGSPPRAAQPRKTV